jgi:putative addiction module component (TIGR02574 family)
MSTLTKANILSLSVPERIQLVEDIWDTVAEMPDEVVLTDEQKAEINRRLANVWQEIKNEGHLPSIH